MTRAETGDSETITLHELLERSARSALELQREDGSFPPGRNYTYDEPETPVRTTSHWTITLSEVYKITGEEKFARSANSAIEYLLSEEARPMGHTFHCRNAPRKDRCNGIVGQATPIRALAHAGPILERKEAVHTAINVFESLPFDDTLGLWETVEVNGERQSFDRTLNHQIIFAAGSRKLCTMSNDVRDRLRIFLDKLGFNMRVYPNGLIKHYVRPPPRVALSKAIRSRHHFDLIINELVYHYFSRSDKRRRKERGYHIVNQKGLGQLKRVFNDHPVWHSEAVEESIEYTEQNVDNLLLRKDADHGTVLPGIGLAGITNAFDLDLEMTDKDLVAADLNDKLDRETFLLKSQEIHDSNISALVSTIVDLSHDQYELEVILTK